MLSFLSKSHCLHNKFLIFMAHDTFSFVDDKKEKIILPLYSFNRARCFVRLCRWTLQAFIEQLCRWNKILRWEFYGSEGTHSSLPSRWRTDEENSSSEDEDSNLSWTLNYGCFNQLWDLCGCIIHRWAESAADEVEELSLDSFVLIIDFVGRWEMRRLRVFCFRLQCSDGKWFYARTCV